MVNPILHDDATPRLEKTAGSGSAVLVLKGRLSAAPLAEPGVFQALNAALKAAGPVQLDGAAWNLLHLQALDHTGAQLLWNAWGRKLPLHLQASPPQLAMLARVERFTVVRPPAAVMTHAAARAQDAWQAFLGLGALLFVVWGHATDLVRLLGRLVLDLWLFARHPHKGPWRDISGNLYRIGATAMPITALVGFLIGVVLAYLMSQQLRQFGADAFIVDVLGISLIRELGPVLAAILLAGRSGSAITAQIGVMRVTEELDAMKVMGISPGFRLVMPRAIAMAIAMPLISVWTILAALAGGVLASDLVLGITPEFFVMALPNAVQSSNLALAVGKSAVFGILIALIGCHYGLRISPNTESLGQGTTASVVTSITVVILVDALFAVLFKDIGI